MDIQQFVEDSTKAATPEEVFDRFCQVVTEFGFDKCIFGGSNNDDVFKDRYDISLPAPIILNNYPLDWTKYYLEKDYAKLDPIIQLMPRMWGPLIWRDVPDIAKTTRNQRKMMGEAEEAGLCNGISIPMRGPDGETFVISLASTDQTDLEIARRLPEIRLLAAQFFFAFTDLWAGKGQISPIRLTKRERECLQWSALGKSAWETSVIAHISEATVRFHLANAFKKLGATNRVSAIVRALRWGLIHL